MAPKLNTDTLTQDGMRISRYGDSVTVQWYTHGVTYETAFLSCKPQIAKGLGCRSDSYCWLIASKRNNEKLGTLTVPSAGLVPSAFDINEKTLGSKLDALVIGFLVHSVLENGSESEAVFCKAALDGPFSENGQTNYYQYS